MSSMITDKGVKLCSSAKIPTGRTNDMFVLQQQPGIAVDGPWLMFVLLRLEFSFSRVN